MTRLADAWHVGRWDHSFPDPGNLWDESHNIPSICFTGVTTLSFEDWFNNFHEELWNEFITTAEYKDGEDFTEWCRIKWMDTATFGGGS